MNDRERGVGIEVPKEWREDAEDMDVALTEYVRRMVRAGQRQWGYDHEKEPKKKGIRVDNSTNEALEKALQTALLQNLSTTEGIGEEELADLLFDDLITDLGKHLQTLKDSGEADYNPRDGGWIKLPDGKQ